VATLEQVLDLATTDAPGSEIASALGMEG
jgi:hypothetical protein